MSVNEAARPTGSSPSSLPATVRATSAVTRPLWLLADLVMGWHERWRQRQALMALDDHLLKDIGLSRADAEGEGDKPFWKE